MPGLLEPPFDPMKLDFFVIGASGFIGRVVCAELAGTGLTVHGVGRTRDAEIPGVHWINVDDYDELTLPPGGVCLHLAGRSKFRGTYDSKIEEAHAMALTEKIAHHDFSKVVFASTALVYGDQQSTPHLETDPVFPRSAYARMKLKAEEVMLERGRTVARIANVYVTGMAESNVFSRILSEMEEPDRIRVRDLNAVRDFIDVRDVARGLTALAMGGQPGIFNVGSGTGASVRQLVDYIAEEAGESAREIVAEAENSPESILVIDPGKMKAAFGWRAEIPIRKGVRHLVAERFVKRSSFGNQLRARQRS